MSKDSQQRGGLKLNNNRQVYIVHILTSIKWNFFHFAQRFSNVKHSQFTIKYLIFINRSGRYIKFQWLFIGRRIKTRNFLYIFCSKETLLFLKLQLCCCLFSRSSFSTERCPKKCLLMKFPSNRNMIVKSIIIIILTWNQFQARSLFSDMSQYFHVDFVKSNIPTL